MANEAWSLGWQTGTKLAADQRARKEMLVDEDRKNRVAGLYAQRDSIVKTLPSLKKVDPAAYKQAQDTLNQIHTSVEEIYHPVQNPGALQKDWHWLAGLIHKPPTPHAVLSTTTEPSDQATAPDSAATVVPTPSAGVPPQETTTASPDVDATVSPDVISRWQSQTDLPVASATPAPVRAPASAKPAPMTKQQRQRKALEDRARAETAMDIASAGLDPEQEAQIKTRASALETREAVKNANQMWDEENPPGTVSEADRKAAHYENFQRLALGITGSYGRAAKPDLQSLKLADGTTTSAQWDADRKVWTYMDNSVIPANLVKGASVVGKPVKKIRLGVVPSPQSPTKFAVIWGDPSNPSDQGAWQWTPIGPTRYQQIINSDSTAKDAFGVITTTSRVTGPQAQGGVNLTGVGQGSDLFRSRGEAGAVDADEAAAGAPAAPAAAAVAGPPATSTPRPAAATPTPQQLRSQVPSQAVVTDPSAQVGTYNNPLPLDGTGHVPDGALMKNGTPMPASMKGAIDRLLDGGDIDKTVSPKDKNAVYDEAQRYGFEQGLFTPKDKLLIREAGSFLNSMQKASSLKVLDSWASRQKLHNAIKAVDGKGGIFTDQIALAFDLTPQENDFLQRFLQARGTVGGLTQLTRGGRTTEAGIKRLQSELPDPLITHSSKFAHIQLQRLLQEITVAQKQGFVADVEADKPTSQTAPPAGAGRVPQLTQQIQQLLQP